MFEHFASICAINTFLELQSTPDNSTFQEKSKQVRVIGNSKKIAGSEEKTVFTA